MTILEERHTMPDRLRTTYWFPSRYDNYAERIRLANAAYDRIHGAARLVPTPPGPRDPAPDEPTRRQLRRATRRVVARLVSEILDPAPDPRSDL